MKKIVITNKINDFFQIELFLETLENEGNIPLDKVGSVLFYVDFFFNYISQVNEELRFELTYQQYEEGFGVGFWMKNYKEISKPSIQLLKEKMEEFGQKMIADQIIIDENIAYFECFFRYMGVSNPKATARKNFLQAYFRRHLQETLS